MAPVRYPTALLAFCSLCYAQAPQPAFEVASVKPNTSLDSNVSLNRTPNGGLDAVNVSTRMLITFAYRLRDQQLSAGPAWLDTERYDIHAKAPANSPAADDFFDKPVMDLVRERTKALLADRFKLVLRTETRDMPAYALVLAKGSPGPKLIRWKEGDEQGPQTIGRGNTLTCKKITMKALADGAISSRLGRNVIDKTGLEGDFNFTIEFVPDPPARATAVADLTGPTFVDALREQLGLKLESQKAPVDFYVIDHVDHPSGN